MVNAAMGAMAVFEKVKSAGENIKHPSFLRFADACRRYMTWGNLHTRGLMLPRNIR